MTATSVGKQTVCEVFVTRLFYDLDFIHMDKQDQRKLQTTTLPLAFDATSIEGISSEFDKAHFQCEAHYKEAWNGELVEVIKTKRWPADENIIRVIGI